MNYNREQFEQYASQMGHKDFEQNEFGDYLRAYAAQTAAPEKTDGEEADEPRTFEAWMAQEYPNMRNETAAFNYESMRKAWSAARPASEPIGTTELRKALKACVAVMLHNGVPVDKDHPARVALDLAEDALYSPAEDKRAGCAPHESGTFVCPICGKNEPHQHSGEEVAKHRHEQAMRGSTAHPVSEPQSDNRPTAQDAYAEFKNFHRALCERFDYTHDERDWKRDQISLIEWIAKKFASNPKALTDHEIEAGWHKTFSTSNPYCPCNLKSFTKAVRWAEHALLRAASGGSEAE